MLNVKAFSGLLLLFLVMAALLFIPAGTLDYWQAWTFLAVYFAASLAITLYLVKKDPALLARRMSGGPTAEKEMTQKIIMSFTSLGFVGLLVVPALDHRFEIGVKIAFAQRLEGTDRVVVADDFTEGR